MSKPSLLPPPVLIQCANRSQIRQFEMFAGHSKNFTSDTSDTKKSNFYFSNNCLTSAKCLNFHLANTRVYMHTYEVVLSDFFQLLRAMAKLYLTEIINNPYPTAFPYGNGMVLHFYQQQENSTTKTVHKVINKRLKTYV